MKNKLLIATTNQGKLSELKKFLCDLPLNFISLSDLNIKKEFKETGKTYRENSVKKARFFAKLSSLPTIADDGGIELDALGGKPGVHSRRFFGENGEREASDEEIIKKMKVLIRKLPKDACGAKFKAVLTFALPNGNCFSRTGEVRGVLKEPYLKLLKGYPYRSFFYLPKIKKYYHENELTEEEQKMYNHRYKAIQKLKPIIQEVFDL